METTFNEHQSLHASPSRGYDGKAMISLFGMNMQTFIHHVTPAQLMECAEGFAKTASEIDPDNFDALWSGLVASLRTARTAPPSAGWTDAEIEQHEAEHPQNTPPPYANGLVPTCPEDVTMDVCNAREAQYLSGQ